jgi:hypothetical protein
VWPPSAIAPGVVATARELDLELHIVLGDALLAHYAVDAHTPTTPHSIRVTSRGLSVLDRCAGFLAKETFVGHA